MNRMSPVSVNHTVALDGGVVGKIRIRTVIQDIYSLYVFFIIVDRVDQTAGRIGVACPAAFCELRRFDIQRRILIKLEQILFHLLDHLCPAAFFFGGAGAFGQHFRLHIVVFQIAYRHHSQ